MKGWVWLKRFEEGEAGFGLYDDDGRRECGWAGVGDDYDEKVADLFEEKAKWSKDCHHSMKKC